MPAFARAATPTAALPSIADKFLNCLALSRHVRQPFDFWLLNDVLPADHLNAILALPIPPPSQMDFNGRRETNNSKRIFFNRESQEKYPACRRVAEGFNDPRVRAAIEAHTGTDLKDTSLRIEYCQDAPGFWLEPHTDIFVKKFTMLIYLLDSPGLKSAGTDIHEGPPDFTYVTTAPYGRNLGVIFIPSKDSWHGVGHHPLRELRKSLIINFVGPSWRDKWELA